MADIDAGKISVVVVYKVDRLTRSLADFAKIIDRFNAQFPTLSKAALYASSSRTQASQPRQVVGRSSKRLPVSARGMNRSPQEKRAILPN